MMTFLVIVVVAFIAWKGYFAVRRAVSSYQRDRQEHDSCANIWWLTVLLHFSRFGPSIAMPCNVLLR